MHRFHDTTTGIPERKSTRKELCLKPSVAATIRKAARATGMDESTFIVSAAYLKAQDIEQAQFFTILDEAQFAAFAEAVDAPGRRIEKLAQLTEQARTLFADE